MVEYFSNEAILTYTPINVPSTIKVKKIKYTPVGIILNPIKKNIEVLVQTLRQKNYSAKLAINHI
jgi:hypothetical protein